MLNSETCKLLGNATVRWTLTMEFRSEDELFAEKIKVIARLKTSTSFFRSLGLLFEVAKGFQTELRSAEFRAIGMCLLIAPHRTHGGPTSFRQAGSCFVRSHEE